MSQPTLTLIPLLETPEAREFRMEVHNPTDHDLWVDEVELFHADALADLGVMEEGCLFFRTGRHKNDMPAVAAFGCMDERMQDALGSMTESGDHAGAGGSVILSDHLTLLGSGDRWCMLSFPGGQDQLVHTRITVDDGGRFLSLSAGVTFRFLLRPGERVLTEALRVETTSDPMAAIRRFADGKAVSARLSTPPSVFCTWYYYGLTVTQEDVLTNLRRMQELKLPFDVFQIDEGWEITLGHWEANHKFPLGMKALADIIREAGYRPGLWTSPFIASAGAPVWQEHPEWILHDRDGQICLFPMNDTVYQVLDITHPGVLPYLTEIYRHFTFDWGYTYHKLDFTRAAVLWEDADFYNKHIPLARAYREAVAAIRRGMGEDAYFLMCGGLYDPIIGLVDAQRSGSDVLSMWSSTINKGGKTAPYTIKQSLLRFYMNRWWHNDPDALMVRRNDVMERNLRLTLGLLTDDEVRTVTLNQFIGGGIMCCTEPLDRIDRDRLDELRHLLPPMATQVEPLDLLAGSRFPGRVRVTFPGDDRVMIALINWSDDAPLPACITLDEATLGRAFPEGTQLLVSQFHEGSFQRANPGDTMTLSSIAPHSALLVKVEPIGDAPLVAASTGHFSMGRELEGLRIEGGRLCFTCAASYPAPVSYTVLLPDGEELRFTLLPQQGLSMRLPLMT